MVFKSIIIEEKPTENCRVYKKGSLQKFKDYLQESINNKKCFVWLGTGIPDYNLEHVIGTVNSFNIVNGQGIFDIDLNEPVKSLVESISHTLQIDFYLNAMLSDETDNNGNSYVDLTDFSIDGLRLIKVNNESNN